MSLLLTGVGPSALGFDPASIANLVARWTPGVLTYKDNGVTLANSGDTVQLLKDRIGSNNGSQATAGNRPLFTTAGGAPELQFDGVGTFLSIPFAIIATYPATVFAKVRITGTVQGGLLSWGSTSGTEGGWTAGFGNGTNLDGPGNNQMVLFGGSRNIAGPAGVTGIVTVGWRFRDTGTQAITTQQPSGGIIAATNDTGTEPLTAQSAACIGSQAPATAKRPLTNTCLLRDLILYSRALSDNEFGAALAGF